MLACQKHLFSLPEQTTYLNCAYMSPLSKAVEEAGMKGIVRKRNPAQVTPEDFFSETEQLRKAYASLINCAEPNRIVTVASVSYGLANVANNVDLRNGNKIIVVDEQFPSNYYAWERLQKEKGAHIEIVKAPETVIQRGKLWNERILEAIDDDTALVAMGNVHWADGTLFDLQAIRKRTLETGSLLVIDGTQSVGALPFDIDEIKPDALVCGGYKWLMGPYGMGLAYYGEYFDSGKPIEENWINRLGSEDFTNLVNYSSDYKAGSLRYEVGEHSNFILIPMLLEAIKQLNHWGVDNIQQYCQSITKASIEALKKVGFHIEEEAYRSNHLFGVRIPANMEMAEIRRKLDANNIFVSVRGDAIRIAPNLYNDVSDIEKLVNVLTN